MSTDDIQPHSGGVALQRIAVAAAALEGIAQHIARRERHSAGLRPQLFDADAQHRAEIGCEAGGFGRIARMAANEVAAAGARPTAKLTDRIRDFDAVAEHHRM
jgi:hypothetical protein